MMMGGQIDVADDFLTRREAAALAGVHVNTVRLWETTGRVEVKKRDDGIVLVRRTDIEAIIEQRTSHPRSDAERNAGLEAENRELRHQLEYAQRQLAASLERYDQLLQRVLSALPAE